MGQHSNIQISDVKKKKKAVYKKIVITLFFIVFQNKNNILGAVEGKKTISSKSLF